LPSTNLESAESTIWRKTSHKRNAQMPRTRSLSVRKHASKLKKRPVKQPRKLLPPLRKVRKARRNSDSYILS